MNAKHIFRVAIVVLAALALTALVAAAQEPSPGKQLPLSGEKGESIALTATVTESEPNDTLATADPVAGPGMVSGKIGVPSDRDYFHFIIESTATYQIIIEIDAASAGSALDSLICYYDQDGVLLSCNDDSDGFDSLLYVWTDDPDDDFDQDFYVRVEDAGDGNSGNDYFYTLNVTYATFVSAATAGKAGGVAFAPGDILARAGNKWLLMLDASDLGITANTNSFDMNPDGAYLAFPKNVTVTGQNGSRYTATPWDVVHFNPTQWGPTTRGSFDNQLYFDGSTKGLSAASEKIDAIAAAGPWMLEISTIGAAAVPAWNGGTLAGRDEDILHVSLPAGTWDMEYDGSTIPGLANEDIVAAYTGSVNAVYWLDFVILGTGVIDGHAVNQKDKLVYVDGDGMDWPAIRYFNYNLDAIDGMH